MDQNTSEKKHKFAICRSQRDISFYFTVNFKIYLVQHIREWLVRKRELKVKIESQNIISDAVRAALVCATIRFRGEIA